MGGFKRENGSRKLGGKEGEKVPVVLGGKKKGIGRHLIVRNNLDAHVRQEETFKENCRGKRGDLTQPAGRTETEKRMRKKKYIPSLTCREKLKRGKL